VEERKVCQTRINEHSGVYGVNTLHPADIKYPECNKKHRDTHLSNHNAMKTYEGRSNAPLILNFGTG
jgi:hypothetical protein